MMVAVTFGGSPLSTQQSDWDPRAAGDGFPATPGECGSGAASEQNKTSGGGGAPPGAPGWGAAPRTLGARNVPERRGA